jgi:hypothetical protein
MLDQLKDQLEEIKANNCAGKIASELKDREEYLSDLFFIIDSNDAPDSDRDQARQEIEEMAYGIDTRTVSRVVWSGGGPADYLEITHKDGEVLSVEYLYQEWFDGAKLSVEEGSPAYRYALELIEILNA